MLQAEDPLECLLSLGADSPLATVIMSHYVAGCVRNRDRQAVVRSLNLLSECQLNTGQWLDTILTLTSDRGFNFRTNVFFPPKNNTSFLLIQRIKKLPCSWLWHHLFRTQIFFHTMMSAMLCFTHISWLVLFSRGQTKQYFFQNFRIKMVQGIFAKPEFLVSKFLPGKSTILTLKRFFFVLFQQNLWSWS